MVPIYRLCDEGEFQSQLVVVLRDVAQVPASPVVDLWNDDCLAYGGLPMSTGDRAALEQSLLTCIIARHIT